MEAPSPQLSIPFFSTTNFLSPQHHLHLRPPIHTGIGSFLSFQVSTMGSAPLALHPFPPNLLHLHLHSPHQLRLILAGISLSRSKCHISRKFSALQRRKGRDHALPGFRPKDLGVKCIEERETTGDAVLDKDDGDHVVRDAVEFEDVIAGTLTNGSAASQKSSAVGDALSLGIREPVYEVVEVRSNGMVSTRKINRRHLLKSSGLRPRDIRSVDPSLWLTNSMPSLLVRQRAVLLNLGSLRAIVMEECVYIFNYNRKGGKAFIDNLLPRLNPKNMSGGHSMPFVLEVVEAALQSRIQRLENRLMELEPRVQGLLEVLPNRLTADILEELRINKQTLVELGSRAGALKQMLLDILEDTHEIRQICIMGRNCSLLKNNEMVCAVASEKEIAEEEEEEIEMLLENYLQRCESCHGQAERLLDSAKEMEDSIAVNLSSRRLEVSRVELLLQVGTFCIAVGALVAGIFGMNLRSYLEEHVYAFWLTTAGIFIGAIVGFFLMYFYLRRRKIL